jgi:rhodanese-related sulfurtransferase
MMKKGIETLLAEANAVIENYTVQDAMAKVEDEGVAFIDLREVDELHREGKLPGAVHAPRGMLEYYIDPESPYHKEIFSSGKEIIFYCASGGRSALAAQTAQEMGLSSVANLAGGLIAWKEAEGPVKMVTVSPRRS